MSGMWWWLPWAAGVVVALVAVELVAAVVFLRALLRAVRAGFAGLVGAQDACTEAVNEQSRDLFGLTYDAVKVLGEIRDRDEVA